MTKAKYNIGFSWTFTGVSFAVIGVRPSPKTGLPFYRIRRVWNGRMSEINMRETMIDSTPKDP